MPLMLLLFLHPAAVQALGMFAKSLFDNNCIIQIAANIQYD